MDDGSSKRNSNLCLRSNAGSHATGTLARCFGTRSLLYAPFVTLPLPCTLCVITVGSEVDS